MTQFIPMRTTVPPSSAPQPAAGGRLRRGQKFRVEATGISAEGSARGTAGGANQVNHDADSPATGALRSHLISRIPISL
jgi:hypothetical protein